MEKGNKKQMAKFVNVSKDSKGCKLLGIEGYFAAPAESSGELSNLCRLVLRANDTTKPEALKLTANIPIAEMPSILELSRIALNDFPTAKSQKFTILEGVAKPKVSDKNEEGTLVYSVEILYDSSRIYPVTINVKNFRADVSSKSGGRLAYSAPKGKIQQISYFVKIRDFYNAFVHIDDLYKAWCAKTAIDNSFNGSI